MAQCEYINGEWPRQTLTNIWKYSKVSHLKPRLVKVESESSTRESWICYSVDPTKDDSYGTGHSAGSAFLMWIYRHGGTRKMKYWGRI